ncbi:MAG: twin-arginine translocation signal domain-containing protein [Bacteroidaceae bacterium]|nr:twin-arginine translocation signal domain-containing protein [Bacteroidaceae bacterium]
MDRRDFIKKAALATAGVAITAPVAAMMTKAENAGLMESGVEHAYQTKANGKTPKVLLVHGSPRADGNTFCCLKEIEAQLQKHGIGQNKPAAALAVCRRGGATATLQTMNMMFEMMNMPVVTSQYWNIAYGAGKGEVKLDTEGMQTMRTLATNMAFLLEKIHADGNPAPKREERPAFMNFIR